jgi:hypothetical protein
MGRALHGASLCRGSRETWTLTVIVAIIAKQQQPAKDVSLLYAVEPIPVFLY